MKDLRPGRRSLLLVSALSLVCAAFVSAADILTVESILTYPESFNREIVTLKGTVRGVVNYLGGEGYSQVCIQDFKLDDGTGTVQVQYVAYCEVGGQRVIEVHDGDRVVVTATMDVFPDNIGSAGGNKFRTRATATQIVKSDQ